MAILTDKDIIKKELEKFENKQRSTLPSEIFDLPSDGLVYPKDHPFRSGKVEMRYMTAYDEDILTNNSYIEENVVLDKLLTALIISDGDQGDLIPADKDALIIAARIVGYGKDYPVIVEDPKSKRMTEYSVDLTKLKAHKFDLEPDDKGHFKYKGETGPSLTFKYISSTESKLLSSSENVNVSLLMELMITSIDGDYDKSKITDFIKFTFLAKDARNFRDYVTSKIPGLNMSYTFTREPEKEGEEAGTFTAGFQIRSDIFWL